MFGFSDFIGKTIQETLIDSTHEYMLWKVDDVWYNIKAMGDCCSYSWFQHCDNADVFDNAKLLKFENIGEDEIENGDEYIKVNVLKFRTEKGDCTIEFRNSSNGWYSGWAEITEAKPGNSDEVEFGKMLDF